VWTGQSRPDGGRTQREGLDNTTNKAMKKTREKKDKKEGRKERGD